MCLYTLLTLQYSIQYLRGVGMWKSDKDCQMHCCVPLLRELVSDAVGTKYDLQFSLNIFLHVNRLAASFLDLLAWLVSCFFSSIPGICLAL